MRALAPALLSTALLAGCARPAADIAPTGPCAGGLPEGEVEVFAEGFGATEGIALSPDGRMFVTATGMVAEVWPDGTWSEVAPLEGGVGLAWWGERLMAAGRPDGEPKVVAIDVDRGIAEPFTAEMPTGPNFLTVTPWGTLLVSDADAAIHEVQPDGSTSIWLSVPGPNGMAFNAGQDALWVVNTWDDPAPAWRVPVFDGAAGDPEEVHAYPGGNFPDGVALGQSGTLYVSLNVTGLISAITPDGTESTVAEGAAFTASLAFGEGEAWPACTVYSTSLLTTELFAIGVGEAGLPPLR